ncbi:MAG: GGDEF domain-containing protein [Desulfobacterales bacterium]|nr:GGDEF domain-containing protein [Desulfobacterales bacterium]MDD4071959.1 GGDEF domain-containing protein [Desulfobacterales bacterium]MDD4392091.1 GGDEF domain-containing protein [Desulfobacterales bacterium]
MAFHDPLTGLLNRRIMEMQLKREFSRAKRYDVPLSVAFLDMDDFKRINDVYGHDQGDSLLKHVADNLLRMSRESDIVSRFAGDEFVVIFPETGMQNATNSMKRIEQYFQGHPMAIGDESIPVSMSFGIASTEEAHVTSAAVLLKKADERLYEAKGSLEGSRPGGDIPGNR